jgi:arginine decarboxylase
LVDITCDSDGKVDDFIDLEDVRRTLALHSTQRKSSLLHRRVSWWVPTKISWATCIIYLVESTKPTSFLEDDEEDGFYIEESIPGYSVERILDMIQSDSDLCRMLERRLDKATKADSVRPREGVAMVDLSERLIRSRTYLIPHREEKLNQKKSKKIKPE